jgi:hypothetical protein
MVKYCTDNKGRDYKDQKLEQVGEIGSESSKIPTTLPGINSFQN